MPGDVSIRHELTSGDLVRIVSLHGEAHAQLRWVVVDPVARGAGLGKDLGDITDDPAA